MRGARWVGIALVAWAASACGHHGYPLLPRNVRESVHRDYPACRGRDIRGLDLGGGRYQVLACGMDVVYACATGPHSRWRGCAMEQTSGGYVVAAAPGTAAPAGTVIVVTGGAQGSQTIQAYPAQPAQAQPAQVAPAQAQPAQVAPAQAQPATAQPAPQPATAQPAQATGVPTREQIEAGVGQWIDSHRTEILACTGTPAALVEVSWDAAGALAAALGGEMHGSAGEPCVARVLSGVQLNVGGQAGSVRHVVQ